MSLQWWIHGSENGIHRPIFMLYVNCVELRIYHEKVWCMVSLSVAKKLLDWWLPKKMHAKLRKYF